MLSAQDWDNRWGSTDTFAVHLYLRAYEGKMVDKVCRIAAC
ncbi:hypothetical protein ACIBG8_35855 [Nonomuraea sp. NPDC050556]